MNYIDLHCDTLYRLYTQEDTLPDETPWENRGHIDLSRLHKAGALAQFFACFFTPAGTDTAAASPVGEDVPDTFLGESDR